VRKVCVLGGFSLARWLSPRERAELKLLDVYHAPLWEGDYIGWLRQLTLFEAFAVFGYADQEKRFGWDLPGHGVALDSCGRGFLKGCVNAESHIHGKDFARVSRHNCHRKECPVCFESWASLQAERSLLRIATYLSGFDIVKKTISKAHLENRGKSGHDFHKYLDYQLEQLIHLSRRYVKHVVLSPSQDVLSGSVEDYRLLRKSAYRVARQSGFYGGALVFHPYRLKCSKCGSALPDYQKECVECHGLDFKWFWSPHFHGVGLGWIEKTKEGYSKHGWVVKNLGVRNSVFWTFQYLLSHAGVSWVHTTTWFGKLAYNRMGKTPSSDGFREVCPYCFKPLVPLLWVGGIDRPPPVYDSEDEKNDMLFEHGVVVTIG